MKHLFNFRFVYSLDSPVEDIVFFSFFFNQDIISKVPSDYKVSKSKLSLCSEVINMQILLPTEIHYEKFFVDREFDLPQWSPGVTRIGKILITELDRKIAKQPIGISPHTVLETDLLKLKLCRSFTCAGRFDTRLIRSKKHRPFRLVAPKILLTDIGTRFPICRLMEKFSIDR